MPYIPPEIGRYETSTTPPSRRRFPGPPSFRFWTGIEMGLRMCMRSEDDNITAQRPPIWGGTVWREEPPTSVTYLRQETLAYHAAQTG